MSASGTDHTSGTNAKMSRPNPGPTEWINVSVVYAPPEVEKKRTKTSPTVPIARGSFRLIDRISMHKRATLQQSNLSGKQKRRNFIGFIGEFPEALFFPLRHLCVFVLKKISVTLCPS